MKRLSFAIIPALALTAFVAGGDYRALELNYRDTSVAPHDDFYTYVNGKWMESAVIPDDRGRWGSFDELGKKADSMALQVLLDAVNGNSSDLKFAVTSDEGKAVELFKSVMDIKSRNEEGITPVLPYLNEIEAISNKKQFQKYLLKYQLAGENTFLGFYVGADSKNSNRNVLNVYGGSLGLPDRDYYLKTDEKSVKLQEQYREFMGKVFVEYGWGKNAETAVKAVYAIEREMAENRMSKVERRDPNKRYNPVTYKQLKKMLSSFPVDAMFKNMGIKADTIIVGDLKSMKSVNDVVKKYSVEDLKYFLLWNTMRGSMGMLSENLEKMSFDFYGKTLRGTPAQKALSERALGVVNGTMGEALGKLYVKRYFPEEAKKVAKEMVDDVIAAYRIRINNLDWMSEETKRKANKKLDKLTVKIGYPDKWEDYSTLEIKSYENGGSYFQNMMNSTIWETKKNIEEFNKPVDKTKWGMSPQTVNAYYNPLYNEIVFPAAILQMPFFDFRNDPAVNFGGIGAVIGHEISHGFDDAGAQFDENGNLVNWWTEEDLKQFKERGKMLADQYSAYEALPGKFVNGEFTLGENIGDLGGVASAYDGLLLHLKRQPIDQKIDGYTQEQRFFMSWATIWRGKSRDEELAMRLVTDPHSPGYFRAIGPLQNHEGFYKAFGVKPGNKMYRNDDIRVKIW